MRWFGWTTVNDGEAGVFGRDENGDGVGGRRGDEPDVADEGVLRSRFAREQAAIGNLSARGVNPEQFDGLIQPVEEGDFSFNRAIAGWMGVGEDGERVIAGLMAVRGGLALAGFGVDGDEFGLATRQIFAEPKLVGEAIGAGEPVWRNVAEINGSGPATGGGAEEKAGGEEAHAGQDLVVHATVILESG